MVVGQLPRSNWLKIESVPTERWPQDKRPQPGPEPEGKRKLLEFTGGAWPFLVGGLPCQVDSGNERDLNLLNSHDRFFRLADFLEGLLATSQWKFEAITGL